MEIERWKRAVVHLETTSDSRDSREHIDFSDPSFLQKMMDGRRDKRRWGTALFVERDGSRYLITAWHVIHDEIEARREIERATNQLQRTPAPPQRWVESEMQSANERAERAISSAIFAVPSLDDAVRGLDSSVEIFWPLTHLAVGTTWMNAYSYDADLDLAVISLNRRSSSDFVDALISRGHVPIAWEQVSPEPTGEGAEVYSVGFPAATASLRTVLRDPHTPMHPSHPFDVSVPVTVFGRVAMMHPELPFYWVDMSIYPGNSGGPLIEGDQLVGVVSAQPTIAGEMQIDGDVVQTAMRFRLPFGRIVKATHLEGLMDHQMAKDREWARVM